MAKKKSFTKYQHKKAGLLLKKIRGQLLLFANEVDPSYPNAVSGLVRRAIESITTLASELDNQLAKETTKAEWHSENLQQIYFGPHDREDV